VVRKPFAVEEVLDAVREHTGGPGGRPRPG
jgi:hypothetical protein